MRRPIILLFLATFAVVLILIACDKEETVTGPVDNVVPAAITDLSVAVLDSGRTVVLSFTATGDDSLTGTASRYENYDSAAVLPNPVAPLGPGMFQSLSFNRPLVYQRVYFAAIKVCDEAGNCSDMSNLVLFYTSPTGDPWEPGAVLDLQAINANDTSVVLEWSAPGEDREYGQVAGYEIRYSSEPITGITFESADSSTFVGPTHEPGERETAIVRDLHRQTEYYFAVRALDDVGRRGDISNVVRSTTQANADSIPPAAVSDLAIVDSSEASITLSWTAPGDDGQDGLAYAFDLRYSPEEITPANWDSATVVANPPVPDWTGSRHEKTIDFWPPNIRYHFAIRTQDEMGNWSELSNPASALIMRPADSLPPGRINDLAAAHSDSSSGVVLTWTAPSDPPNGEAAAEYEIFYSTDPISASNPGASYPLPVPSPALPNITESITLAGLANGQEYYFAIVAKDEWGARSDISNVATATPTVMGLQVDWVRDIGTEQTDAAADVIATPDGGCIVLGATTLAPGGESDIIMARFDSAGQLLWERTYGSASLEKAVALTGYGDLYQFVGNRLNAARDSSNPWIVWVDGSGEIIRESLYAPHENSTARGAGSTGNGSLAFTVQAGSQIRLVEADLTGSFETVWSMDPSGSCLGSPGRVSIGSAASDGDGNMAFVWSNSSPRLVFDNQGAHCEWDSFASVVSYGTGGLLGSGCTVFGGDYQYATPDFLNLASLGSGNWIVRQYVWAFVSCEIFACRPGEGELWTSPYVSPSGVSAISGGKGNRTLLAGQAEGEIFLDLLGANGLSLGTARFPLAGEQSATAVTSSTSGCPIIVGTTSTQSEGVNIVVVKLTELP